MSVQVQERVSSDKREAVENSHAVGEAFDPSVIHSDAYYAHYIANFQPNPQKRRLYRFTKRLLDILGSSLLLVLLFPVMLVVGIAVKCDSRGCAIFVQKRVGKDGKTFNCYKFRTMKADAPRECATALLENPQKHITRVGRVLRRLSLDELPQLWCVLVGTMSLIGYRPLVPSETECNGMRSQLGVFSFRPGISGYAQVHGRDDVYYKNKAILDAQYVKMASLWLDVKLALQTVAVVIRCEGNHEEKIR